jgi:hypothetical protein
MQTVIQGARGESLDLITEAGELGVDGPFTAVTAVPFKSPFSPTDLSTKAELDAIAAAFTGSTGIAVVWGAKQIAPNRQPFKSSQLLNWICTVAPDPAEMIYGVYYHDGTVLVGVDVFPSPVLVDGVGSAVSWVATVP